MLIAEYAAASPLRRHRIVAEQVCESLHFVILDCAVKCDSGAVPVAGNETAEARFVDFEEIEADAILLAGGMREFCVR